MNECCDSNVNHLLTLSNTAQRPFDITPAHWNETEKKKDGRKRGRL